MKYEIDTTPILNHIKNKLNLIIEVAPKHPNDTIKDYAHIFKTVKIGGRTKRLKVAKGLIIGKYGQRQVPRLSTNWLDADGGGRTVGDAVKSMIKNENWQELAKDTALNNPLINNAIKAGVKDVIEQGDATLLKQALVSACVAPVITGQMGEVQREQYEKKGFWEKGWMTGQVIEDLGAESKEG